MAEVARSEREGEVGGRTFWIGEPPTVAVDQAAYSERFYFYIHLWRAIYIPSESHRVLLGH